MGTRYLNCHRCGADIEPPQRQTVSSLCVKCADKKAVEARMGWCVAGINKSNLMLITNRETLKQLNPKRTT